MIFDSFLKRSKTPTIVSQKSDFENAQEIIENFINGLNGRIKSDGTQQSLKLFLENIVTFQKRYDQLPADELRKIYCPMIAPNHMDFGIYFALSALKIAVNDKFKKAVNVVIQEIAQKINKLPASNRYQQKTDPLLEELLQKQASQSPAPG